MVSFTAQSASDLAARYRLAVENNEEQFVFEGNDYLTAYAKYLLQHLDQQDLEGFTFK
jgi:hypothetical protein